MLLPDDNNLEIYIEPESDVASGNISNGQNATFLPDYSGNGRNLAAPSDYPIYQIPSSNGRAACFWDGAKNPLKNSSAFTLACGFMVVRVNEPTFSEYRGLLTDTTHFPILVGNTGTTKFYDNLQSSWSYEFRTNDKIYPGSDAPAPMNFWQLIFFRYWKPAVVNGIQVGQDRGFANRKAKMSLGLLALYSRNLIETEIRRYSQLIGANFGLPLANVYPYQADVDNTPERPLQTVNFYDPPEGERISEVLSPVRRSINLKFSGSDQAEVAAMKKFHAAHYGPALPCIYRDYRITPPEDITGYINSPYDLDGSNNDFTYGFSFLEEVKTTSVLDFTDDITGISGGDAFAQSDDVLIGGNALSDFLDGISGGDAFSEFI